MEEQPQEKSQLGNQPKASCSPKQSCYCQALGAALIIVLTWWWTPSWANIAITVIAGLMILGSASCASRFKKDK